MKKWKSLGNAIALMYDTIVVTAHTRSRHDVGNPRRSLRDCWKMPCAYEFVSISVLRRHWLKSVMATESGIANDGSRKIHRQQSNQSLVMLLADLCAQKRNFWTFEFCNLPASTVQFMSAIEAMKIDWKLLQSSSLMIRMKIILLP
jgi:hypothetical protein